MSILPPLEDVLNQQPEPPAPAADAPAAAAPGSLQARVQARRDALENDTVATFDIPGYEGVLAASYRLLGWGQLRSIAARAEKETRDPSLREIYTAADTLINACVDLLEVAPDGTKRPLGIRWGTRAATDIFSRPPQEAGDTARQGLLACFPGDRDSLIVAQFVEWSEWNSAAGPKVDEVLEGESAAGSPGT